MVRMLLVVARLSCNFFAAGRGADRVIDTIDHDPANALSNDVFQIKAGPAA